MSKNILITGVSRGLGLDVARAVLRAGWNVYAVSRTRSPEWVQVEEANQGRVHFREFDLTRVDALKGELFDEFMPFTVPLHGLVNNAAEAYDDLVSNLDIGRLRTIFEINAFAPMLLTKCAIRHMLFNRIGGSIVHLSSICAHTGYKGLAMYASTKGALEAFSKNVAREWGERGIRSNCIVAGFMETQMSGTLSGEQKEKIYRRTALKKAVERESVASTVVHLLGEGADSITGQNVFVDAGTI